MEGAQHNNMDKVVHFELPFDDEARVKNFYSSIFGWDLKDEEMPGGMKYIMATTAPMDETTRMPKESGAINGGMMKRMEGMTGPVFAINVPSIDQYIPKIEAAGGKVIKPKMDVMGMGFYAYVSDTEGNVLGLWEDMKK